MVGDDRDRPAEPKRTSVLAEAVSSGNNRLRRTWIWRSAVGIVWGLIIAAIGALFIAGRTRSEFVVYRLLVARSRLLWGDGDRVHGFYQVAGAMMIVFGAIIAIAA